MDRMTAAAAKAELKTLRSKGLSCSAQDIQAAGQLAELRQIPALDALGAVEAGKLAVNVKTDRAAWNLAHGWHLAEAWRKEFGLDAPAKEDASLIFAITSGGRSVEILHRPGETGVAVKLSGDGAGVDRPAIDWKVVRRDFATWIRDSLGTADLSVTLGAAWTRPEFKDAGVGLLARAASIPSARASAEAALGSPEALSSAMAADVRSVLSATDPGERAANIADLAGPARFFEIRRDGPVDPVSTGPSWIYLRVADRSGPESKTVTITRLQETWKDPQGNSLRHRLVISTVSDFPGHVETSVVTYNQKPGLRLHAFDAEPSYRNTSEHEDFEPGGFSSSTVKETWHADGLRLRMHEAVREAHEHGHTNKERWMDGRGRLHREDGPAVVESVTDRMAPSPVYRDKEEFWKHGRQLTSQPIQRAPER